MIIVTKATIMVLVDPATGTEWKSGSGTQHVVPPGFVSSRMHPCGVWAGMTPGHGRWRMPLELINGLFEQRAS